MSEVKLLTPKEAATLLGMHPTTLANWRVRGTSKLPFVRIGGRIRYSLKAIEQFIEQNTRTHL